MSVSLVCRERAVRRAANLKTILVNITDYSRERIFTIQETKTEYYKRFLTVEKKKKKFCFF